MQISSSSLQGSSQHLLEKKESERESLTYRSPTESISVSVERQHDSANHQSGAKGSIAAKVGELQQRGTAKEAKALTDELLAKNKTGQTLYTRTGVVNTNGNEQAGVSLLQERRDHTAFKSLSAAATEQAPLIKIDDKLNLMLRMIESMTGRRIDSTLFGAADIVPAQRTDQVLAGNIAEGNRLLSLAYSTLAAQSLQTGNNPSALPGTGNVSSTGNLSASANLSGSATAQTFGLSYSYQYSYSETEHSEFSFQGTVSLDSGETLQINHRASFQYHYATTESVNLTAGNLQLIDPLIINFSNSTLQLSEQRYEFDLNQDGDADNIHFASGSTAFLALDRNQDGRINDGGELFGATSGDGFADLAAYDDDGNGFIDKGDVIFTNLLLFSKDAAGQDQIRTLQDSGIAAIGLTNTSTPFSLRASDQQIQGVLRSSGLFITEEGKTGSLHQIDLTV
jgi:hypothetical protein